MEKEKEEAAAADEEAVAEEQQQQVEVKEVQDKVVEVVEEAERVRRWKGGHVVGRSVRGGVRKRMCHVCMCLPCNASAG